MYGSAVLHTTRSTPPPPPPSPPSPPYLHLLTRDNTSSSSPQTYSSPCGKRHLVTPLLLPLLSLLYTAAGAATEDLTESHKHQTSSPHV
ncbi:hypothetical protein Pcinc_032412 [Petrolisthes cinctipes]|uniref:Uncharacterized protein n=1 Tax=Petrolisthes cinctipes TaxID=88211 RepID=A0AAE1EUU4_PETCI|nr:hypothetical protein Pcinc_032412 [Petrolisthes cinctipes]